MSRLLPRWSSWRNVLVIYAFIIPFCAVILFPFYVMFMSALKTDMEIFVAPDELTWWPESAQWQNFRELGREIPLLGRSFLNSAIIALGATALALATALPAAYALGRLKFHGRRFFMQAVLVTQMFSPIVIIVGLYKLFSGTSILWIYQSLEAIGLGRIIPVGHPTALDDNLFGLILVNAAFNLAFCVWMLTGYLATVPREIEEAAQMDGCNWRQILSHVLIPLAAPGIVTAAVFVFIASWNEFLFALTLVRSAERKPVVVTLFSLVGMFEVKWNYVMAGALLAIVPVVILFWLVEKHLVSGLTAGSSK